MDPNHFSAVGADTGVKIDCRRTQEPPHHWAGVRLRSESAWPVSTVVAGRVGSLDTRKHQVLDDAIGFPWSLVRWEQCSKQCVVPSDPSSGCTHINLRRWNTHTHNTTRLAEAVEVASTWTAAFIIACDR